MHFALRWPRIAFLHMCPKVSIFLAFLRVRAHARHPQDCHKMVPRYPKRRILNRAKTRQHMSSIGFDGKLEPAFFQHILIGSVEGSSLNPFNIMHASTHGSFGNWRKTRICSLPHIPSPLSCDTSLDGMLESGVFQPILIGRVSFASLCP